MLQIPEIYRMQARVLIAAAASAVATFATSANAQQLTGTWVVTYDSDIRTDGEKVTVNSRATGRLTLEQKGDSVFGSFKGDGGPNAAGRPLSGTLKGKALSLTTGPVRTTVNINGKATEMNTRTDWIGVVEPTGIRGTMFVQIGERPAPPRKWEAVVESKR